MAQTIQDFVGKTLDEAPITSTHIKVIALIAAGYFFDILDLIVLGALIPDMVASKFATATEAGLIGSATLVGLFIGSVGQGQFTDRLGRKTVYQFNLLLFGVFTILGALSPTVTWLAVARFIAGVGLGAEQPLTFAYAGEYAPSAHSRPYPGHRSLHRRRLRMADRVSVSAVVSRYARLARDLDRHRHRRADRLRGALYPYGIATLVGDAWQRRQGARNPEEYGTAGPTEPLTTDAASDTKTDPFMVVFRQFPGRVIAGMICFSAFFGVAIGLGTWLPNIMNSKGFAITKSLQYTFGMTLAVPCASLFMMFALDKIGRKKTSITAFICAGIMAIVFANAVSDTQLLLAGFVMIFCYQVAGNSMQIFASEVFPTNARASGFGMAAGVGRLATAGIVPAILVVQTNYGVTTVFVCLAIVLLIAAYSVTKLGPEARQLGLDKVAPPTG